MAYSRVNWQNSPSTSTPINATNLNNMDAAIKTNDDKLLGNAPMGNVVVDSIRSKNMWQPILVGNQNNCSVSLSGNTYTFAATGSDMFYGNIASTGTSYTTGMGELFEVQPSTTYSLSLSNSNFSKNYVSFFNSSKASLSYQRYDSNSFSFTTPSNCYYICIRIGNGNSVSGTNYSTTIQLEKGLTATTYAPYQELNPNISGLDNGHMNDSVPYGGLAKRSVRENSTTYTIIDPNYQNSGYIRNAMILCGDSGIMFIRWSGNNSISPTIIWSSLGNKTCTITHSSGTLTFTFSATVYGGINVLFMN